MFHTYIRAILAELPEGVADTAILAGGALRAFYDGTPVKDYDLFFSNKEDFAAARIALAAAWPDDLPFECRGAWTHTAPSGKQFNLVGFCFGSAVETIERFDFRCCGIAGWLEGHVVCSTALEGAIGDAEAKLLVIRNNNGDERTERRVDHYVEDYGYTVELPLEDPLDAVLDDGAPYRPHETPAGMPVATRRRLRRFISTLPRGSGY